VTDIFGGKTRAAWLAATIQVAGGGKTIDVTVKNEVDVFVAAMAGT
jgi:hypothetical protein